MKLAVFGLGYVGSVSAVCLAARGHDVVGVDVNPLKADMLNDGRASVVEPGLDQLTSESAKRREAQRDGRCRSRTDGRRSVAHLRRDTVAAERKLRYGRSRAHGGNDR